MFASAAPYGMYDPRRAALPIAWRLQFGREVDLWRPIRDLRTFNAYPGVDVLLANGQTIRVKTLRAPRLRCPPTPERPS